jgi:hypothetical protein
MKNGRFTDMQSKFSNVGTVPGPVCEEACVLPAGTKPGCCAVGFLYIFITVELTIIRK